MVEKVLISKESVKTYVEYLKQLKAPYKLSISNYTIKLESEFFNMQFLRSKQSPKCFGAYSKLKRDLNGRELPETSKDDIVYFQHDLRNDFAVPLAYSMDLKSAYSTTMLLRGLITADTYNHIKELPKADRLAAVGMLASQKEIFTFNNKNEITNHEHTVNPLQNFFYQCAKDTFDIISECRKIAGNDYLYSWVDCVYITNTNSVNAISDYLRSIGFAWTTEVLYNFKAYRDTKKISLSFWKEKEDKCVLKPFFLPHNENHAAKKMIDLLINQ